MTGMLPLLISLSLAPVPGQPDAGAGRDGPPPWLPRTQTLELYEAASYGLRRSGDGYVYASPNFEARVGRDGVVSFKAKRVKVGTVLSPFGDLARPKGPTLESTLRDRLGKRRRPPAEPVPEATPTVSPGIDWEYLCPRGSNCDTRPLPTLIQVRGNFDLTDEIMRGLGQDPYAAEKARFLSSTFEFRMRLAASARNENLRSALERLPERLDELWGDDRYSARERRRLLYELWSEMDDSAEGQQGAATVMGFIRRRLPCGSPSGYSAEELSAFARQSARRRFVPEGCVAPTPASPQGQ